MNRFNAQGSSRAAAEASHAAIQRSRAVVAAGAAFVAKKDVPLPSPRDVVTAARAHESLARKSSPTTARDIVANARQQAHAAATSASVREPETQPALKPIRTPTQAEILSHSGAHGYPGAAPTVSGFFAARRAIRNGELPA